PALGERDRQVGRLTQRLECHPHTVEVTGSNPVAPTLEIEEGQGLRENKLRITNRINSQDNGQDKKGAEEGGFFSPRLLFWTYDRWSGPAATLAVRSEVRSHPTGRGHRAR